MKKEYMNPEMLRLEAVLCDVVCSSQPEQGENEIPKDDLYD